MSEWAAAKTIAKAIWTESTNTKWRFSKWKAGFWLLAAQILFAVFLHVIYRDLFGARTMGERIAIVLIDAVLFALFNALMKAPTQMYKQNVYTFPLLTSAPPVSVLLGHVLSEIPGQFKTMVLLSLIIASGLGGWETVLFVLSMGVLGMAVSCLSQLTCHLLMALWVKLVPRALTVFLVLSVLGQIALVGGIVWFLTNGTLLSPDFWVDFEQKGLLAVGIWGAVCLVMLIWFGSKRQMFSAWYLHGWLAAVQGEDGKKGGRSGVSNWPLKRAGVVPNIIAKDLVLIANNPITKVRRLVWAVTALVIGGLLYTGVLSELLAQFSWFEAERMQLLLGVASVIVPAHLTFGEMLPSLFAVDRSRRNWYAFTGVSSGQIVRAKLLSGLWMYVLPCAGIGAVYAVLLGLPLTDGLLLAAYAGLLAFVLCGVALGLSAWDMKREEIAASAPQSAMQENVPLTAATMTALMLGYVLLGVAFFGMEFRAETLGGDLVVLAALVLFAAACLAGGSWAMKKRLLEPKG